jgi:hypothetical protein
MGHVGLSATATRAGHKRHHRVKLRRHTTSRRHDGHTPSQSAIKDTDNSQSIINKRSNPAIRKGLVAIQFIAHLFSVTMPPDRCT